MRQAVPKLFGLLLAAVIMAAPGLSSARDELIWMHDSGDWGAWAAYAVPDTDHFIFSFGCSDIEHRVSLHLELPVADVSEGEPGWIELRRDDRSVRYEGHVFFNEMLSEHQVIAHAPSEPATFDGLGEFLLSPGSFTVVIPGSEESLPVDAAAAEALAAVRGVCLAR